MLKSARILVADDQFLIGALVEASLADEGHLITVVASGSDAIAALRGSSEPFEVLVTDVRMEPGPDGWTVAAAARERHAGTAVVYITGDSMDEWRAKGMPKSMLLAKPFTREQVVSAVEELLTNNTA